MHSVILSLVYRNLVSGIDKVTIVVLVFFPIVFLFTAGYSFSALINNKGISIADTVVSYPAYITAGFIGYNSMNSSMIAGAIIWNDRQNGMFHQILTMPFTRLQHITGLILTIIVISVVSSIVIVTAGYTNLIGQVHLSIWSFFYILFGIFACAIFFGSVSTIICNTVKSTEGYFTSTNVILLLFGFGSSALYPSEGIPEALRMAFYINPLSYACDIIRAGIFSINQSYFFEIVVLAILCSIAMPAAVKSLMTVKL